MATLVRCVHCGAPHRVVSSRERFVCSYCQGSNRLESGLQFEELVCPLRCSATRVENAVQRDLQLRGLAELPVRVEASRFVPVWQFVSAEGEEFLLPAGMRDHPITASLRPPASPLMSREDPALGNPEGLPLAPELSRQEAEAAALATFEHPEAPIECIRLLWYAITPVRVSTRVGELDGLFLEGAEKLVLEAVPPAARDEPLRAELLVSLLAYFAATIAVGAASESWPARILAVGGCVLAAWFWFRKLLPRRKGLTT